MPKFIYFKGVIGKTSTAMGNAPTIENVHVNIVFSH